MRRAWWRGGLCGGTDGKIKDKISFDSVNIVETRLAENWMMERLSLDHESAVYRSSLFCQLVRISGT